MRIKKERDYWNKEANSDKFERNLKAKKYLEVIYPIIKDCTRVLEIGCGWGRLILNLAKKMPNCYFCGIDISEQMVWQAIANRSKKHITNVSFLVNDGRTIHKVGLYDGAYSMVTFQHITPEGVENYIKEISLNLKPGGIFFFQFVEGEERVEFSQMYEIKEIIAWLKEMFFEVVEVRKGIIHPSWVWITAKKGA